MGGANEICIQADRKGPWLALGALSAVDGPTFGNNFRCLSKHFALFSPLWPHNNSSAARRGGRFVASRKFGDR